MAASSLRNKRPDLHDFEGGFEVGALSFHDSAVGHAYEEFGKRMLEHLKTGYTEDDPEMPSRFESNNRARELYFAQCGTPTAFLARAK